MHTDRQELPLMRGWHLAEYLAMPNILTPAEQLNEPAGQIGLTFCAANCVP